MNEAFRISYSVDVVLSERDLWPDGNAPPHPDVADVLALIRRYGGILRVLNDWNLHHDGAQVSVTVIPGEDK